MKPTSPDSSSAPAALALERLLPLAESWTLDNQARGHSHRTTEQGIWVLQKLHWWATTFNAPQIGADQLRAWLSYVRSAHERPEGRWGVPGEPYTKTRGNQLAKTAVSSRSIRNYWAVLRTFFRWCVEQGELDASPLEKVKPPIHRPSEVEPLTPTQASALIAAAGERTNHTRARDKALVLFMLDTGLRASELCNLKLADIDTAQRRAWIELGKGGKSRAIWWSADTNRAILEHLRKNHNPQVADAPFFTSAGRGCGEPLTRGGLLQILKRLGDVAGIEGVHPHQMRHTYAVMFLRAGGQQMALKESLGHTSMEMTSRYVRFAAADRAAAARLFSPVTALSKKG